MPRPRILLAAISRSSHYHCISRVVDRNFVFGVRERDVFRKILRQVEAFSGVRVITWTILSNHFHVLLEVPPKPAVPLTDDEILERCRCLYAPRSMDAIAWEFQNAQRIGGEVLGRLRHKYLRRMWNLSEFMLTLKQKFSLWFNRTHGRVGTLWEARFKSVIVEGEWSALLKVAAYIDLNAVRASLVESPEDYRWCGYSEALAGSRTARRGLASALSELKPEADWRDVGPRYRKLLFGIGEESSVRAGLSRDAVSKVWSNGGKLSLAQLLRCRIRYFTDGLAVGSESFIESVFKVGRSAFSKQRKTGARRLRGGRNWGGLRTARALRVEAIAPSGDG
jgi:hypothetical protein